MKNIKEYKEDFKTNPVKTTVHVMMSIILFTLKTGLGVITKSFKK